jgi:hypothetical protein
MFLEGGHFMAVSIADALGQIPLEIGVYHCQVGKLRVEVRVEESPPSFLPAPMDSSDVMLDPWIDLPSGQPITVVHASPGAPLLPDVPVQL